VNVEINTDDQIVLSTIHPLRSLFSVALWAIAILVLAQVILGLVFNIFYDATQGADYSVSETDNGIHSLPILLTLSLFSTLISFPLLLKASPGTKWTEHFEFWAIKGINRQELFRWSLVILVFWLFSSLMDEVLHLPVEPFMLEIKASGDSIGVIFLAILSICIIGPIFEEIIFRGWMFSKIAQTKLGSVGALLITTLIFTLLHSQYEQVLTYFVIGSLGFLLGFIRYRINNISYTIIAHMLFNSASMIALFLS
jgi:membrane protease YdiL (CAAX protease family)